MSTLLVILNVALITFINVVSTVVAATTTSVAFMPAAPGNGMDEPARTARITSAISISQEATLNTMRRFSLLGLAVVVVLDGLGTYWVVGRVLRPMRIMAHTAREISASQLHTRFAVSGPNDEVKQLADAFDVMLGRLDSAFKQQSQFIGNAAHELRTPLAAMRANLDVVQADPQATVGDYLEMAQAVSRSLDRLERMVTDLLLLAREERILTLEWLSLEALIGEVLDDLTNLAASMGVKLRLSCPTEVIVQGNTALLARVFGNLVENGIRYNRPGGEVAVSVYQAGTWAIVTVSDTGVGISGRDQARIFERFYRADDTRARHQGGAGLGLAIAAHIIQRHGGEIDMQSTPGTGSTFIVKLPTTLES